jgi:hypothetical protein
MGFYVSLNGKPSISTSALQSFKEPKDWLVSFEICRPPRFASSARTSREKIQRPVGVLVVLRIASRYSDVSLSIRRNNNPGLSHLRMIRFF